MSVVLNHLATLEAELVSTREWLHELAAAPGETPEHRTVQECREFRERIPQPPFMTFMHLAHLQYAVIEQLKTGAPGL